jgi:hypothetical protein
MLPIMTLTADGGARLFSRRRVARNVPNHSFQRGVSPLHLI